MATNNILDNVTATSVRIQGDRGEIGINFKLYRHEHVGSLRIKRNSVIIVAEHVTPTLFHDDVRLEARSTAIAEIFYRPTRADLKEAVRSGGQSLIETLKPYAAAHDPTFRNGDLKRLVTACSALSALLDREIECTSGVADLAPRIRIRWHSPSEDPGFLKCLSRWFGWRKWTHTLHDGCLLLRPESLALSPLRKIDDLDSLWLAIAGLEHPATQLTDQDSAHEALDAERRYEEETIPAALATRDAIARASRLSPARLEQMARDMIVRHRRA